MRGLIKPAAGHGIAYIDWSQQEFGIAAALSGDPLMMQAYHSGAPYLEFAKQAGAAPPGAAEQNHKAVREQFKACVLAVEYGMGADSLGRRIGRPPVKRDICLNCIAKPIANSGNGRMRHLIMRCLIAVFMPLSVGRCMLAAR